MDTQQPPLPSEVTRTPASCPPLLSHLGFLHYMAPVPRYIDRAADWGMAQDTRSGGTGRVVAALEKWLSS